MMDVPPIALTDAHVAELERAIRAEGYNIFMNDETGEIRLEREPVEDVWPVHLEDAGRIVIDRSPNPYWRNAAMEERPFTEADDAAICIGCDRRLKEGERGVCATCEPHYTAG